MQPSREPKFWKLLRNFLRWDFTEICEGFLVVQISKFPILIHPSALSAHERKSSTFTAGSPQVSMFPGKSAETGKFLWNRVRTDAEGTADHSQLPELWRRWEGFCWLLHSQLNPNRDGRSLQETEDRGKSTPDLHAK